MYFKAIVYGKNGLAIGSLESKELSEEEFKLVIESTRGLLEFESL